MCACWQDATETSSGSRRVLLGTIWKSMGKAKRWSDESVTRIHRFYHFHFIASSLHFQNPLQATPPVREPLRLLGTSANCVAFHHRGVGQASFFSAWTRVVCFDVSLFVALFLWPLVAHAHFFPVRVGKKGKCKKLQLKRTAHLNIITWRLLSRMNLSLLSGECEVAGGSSCELDAPKHNEVAAPADKAAILNR